MGSAVKAEIRKMLTTRMWWGMAIAIFSCGALFALLFGAISRTKPDPNNPGVPVFTPLEAAINTYTGGVGFGYVFLMVIGIMTIGAEYRHKTITGTLLANPKRPSMIASKVIALLAFGILYGLVFLVGSVSVGAAILSARGLQAFPEAGTLTRSLLLVLLVLGLWALIGLGLGVLIPNQVAAILIGVGIAFIVEPIIGFAISSISWGKDVAQFLPSQATAAVLGGYTGDPDATTAGLNWWQGSLTLLVYAAIFVAIGTWLTNRRDVT